MMIRNCSHQISESSESSMKVKPHYFHLAKAFNINSFRGLVKVVNVFLTS